MRARWSVLLAFLVWLCGATMAMGQVVTLNDWETTVATGSYGINVAVDNSGDVYAFTDGNPGDFIKYTPIPGTSNYTETDLGGFGLNQAQGLFVDSAGDLYIATAYNGTVKETPTTSGGYTQTVVTNAFWSSSVAVDANGNIYIADYNGGNVWKETPLGGGGYTQSLVTNGLSYPCCVALDSSGNVYIADSGNDRILRMQPLGVGYAQFDVVTGVRSIESLAVDGNANLYYTGGGSSMTIFKLTRSGTGYTQTNIPVDGVGNVAVDSSGNIYIAGTVYIQPGSSPILSNGVARIHFGPVNFGSVTVGLAEDAILNFTFNVAAETGRGALLTEGAPNLDYLNNDNNTVCFGYVATPGTICNEVLEFVPTEAGSRYGAVDLDDNAAGALVGQALVQGYGVAPQTVIYPGTQNVVANSVSNGLTQPTSVAVDALGNQYIADPANNLVLKETFSAGKYTQSVIANYSSNAVFNPTGIAMDGAGNIYIADTGNNRVLLETLSNGTYIQSVLSTNGITNLLGPAGVAVDGAGDVYIADTGNSRVVLETLSNGVYTPSVIPTTGLLNPGGVAVDSSGNIYIADTGNNRVVLETPSGGSYTQSVVVSGLANPAGVAVDGSGNVYIADTGNNRILFEASGSYAQSVLLSTGLSAPAGIAVDGLGNLTIADTGNKRVLQLDVFDTQTFTFAQTAVNSTSSDSPKTGTLFNIGNQPLSIAIPSSGNNPVISSSFTLNSTGGSACPLLSSSASAPGTLGVSASCTLPISFTPLRTGNITGTLVMTDNALNEFDATQTIDLNSTGLPGTLTFGTMTFSPAAMEPFGTSQAITISDTVTYNSVQPTGAVRYVLNGVIYTATCTTTGSPETCSATVPAATIAALPIAAYTVTGSFTADNVYSAATAASGTFTITGAPATFGSMVFSPAATEPYGTSQAVTISDTVTYGGVRPTGAVTYVLNGVSYTATCTTAGSPETCSATVPAATIAALPTAVYTVTGSLAADSSYVASTATSGTFTVTGPGTAHVSGYRLTTNITPVPSPLGGQAAIAADASGNLYWLTVDTGPGTQEVVKESLSGGAYSESVVVPSATGGFNGASGIAVDGSGNLYIADTGNGRVLKETLSGNSYVQSTLSSLNSGGGFSPSSIAADANGNVFVVSNRDSIIEGVRSGNTYTLISIPFTYPSGGSNYIEGIAVDSSDNLYIVFLGFNGGQGGLYKLTLSGSSYTQSAIGDESYSVAVGADGTVYAAGNTTGVEVYLPAGGTNYTESARISSPGTYNTIAVAVDGNGYVYTLDEAHGTIYKTSPVVTTGYFGNVPLYASTQGNFGNNACCAAAQQGGESSISFIVDFDTAGEIGGYYFQSIYGASGAVAGHAEFVNLDTGTCESGTVYAAGASCTYDVGFQPLFVGSQYGAVVVENSAGAVMATGYVWGTGVGAEAVVYPGTMSTIMSGANLTGGMAFDPAGNLYVIDADHVDKLTPSGGSYTQSMPLGSLYVAGGLAVDGAGNIYLNANGSDAVKETLLGPSFSGTYTQSALNNSPYIQPLAVDGAGNVYAANTGPSLVKYSPASGGYLTSVVPNSCQYIDGVSVDGNLNVYVQCSTPGAIYKETPSGGGYTESQVVSASSGAFTVDGSGNLYIADGNSISLATPAAGGGYTQTVLLSASNGFLGSTITALAVDAVGNLYFIDLGSTGTQLVKVDVNDPQTFNFASTPVGQTSSDSPRTAMVVNIGNAPLSIAIPSTGNNASISSVNFQLNSTSSGACPLIGSSASMPGTLAGSTVCLLPISFVPTTVGNLTGQLVLTDNTLSATGSTQIVNLNGTGQLATLTFGTMTFSPAATEPYGTNQAVTISDTVTYGGVQPTGAVTYVLNGVSYTATCTTAGSPETCSATVPAATIAALPVAGYTVTGGLAADSNYAAATAASGTFTITKGTASFGTMTFSPSSTEPYGTSQAVTISDTVTYGGVRPTGAVTYVLNSVSYTATCTTAGSPETCSVTVPAATIAALPVSSYTVTGSLSGDINYAPTTAASGTFTITKATASFGTMTFSPAASEPSGTSQAITISDTATYGGVQPTGTVTYVLNGVSYTATCTTAGSPETCSATVPAATIAALPVAGYTVTGGLAADSNYAASTAASGTFTITKGTASFGTMTFSPAATEPYGTNQAVTISDTLTYNSVQPTGAVSYVLNGVSYPATCTTAGSPETCSATVPAATIAALPVAVYAVTGSFAGDNTYAAATATSGTFTVIRGGTASFGTMTFSPAATEPYGTSQAVTISDTVTYGGVQPTGAVTYVLNGVSYTATCTTAGSPETCSATVPAATIAALPVAGYTVTGGLAADSNYAAATAASGTFTITIEATRSTLVASGTTLSAGQPVTLTVTVTASTGAIPTGTVTIYNGATSLGTATLNGSGVGTLTLTLSSGSYSLTAGYGGSANNAPSTSSPATLVTVSAAPTTTTLTASASSVTVGQTLTLTATVSATAGGTPGGTVTFYNGATSLGSAALNASGVATLTLTPTVGTYSITAGYGGNSSDTASTSSPATSVTVVLPTTTTVLTASATTLVVGQTLTLTATVTNSGGTAPTGVVTFHNGLATLGTGALNAGGVATLTLTPALGSYSITASYPGDSNNAASTSGAVAVNVVVIGTTSVTLSASATTLTYGQTLTLTGTANGTISGHTPTGTISFTSGATPLGTSPLNASGVATYSYIPAAGTYSMGAAYAGDTFNAAASATPLTVTVNPAATTLSLSSSLNPAPIGSAITFTVSVQSSAGIPTGSVTLMDGTTVLSSLPLNAAGTATYSTSGLALGTHSLTASYAATGNFAASQATLSQIVLAPPSFSVAATGPLTLVTEQNGPITITVTPVNGFSGNVTLSCSTLPAYATCEWGTSLLTSTTVGVSGGPASTQLVIDTSAVLGYEASNRFPGTGGSRFLLAGLALPMLLFLNRGRRRRVHLLMWVVVLCVGAALSGCAGKYPASTPPGTYNVTILGSSGSVQNIGILTLIVTN